MRRLKGNQHYFLAQFLPLAAMVLAAAAFLYHSRIDAELRRLQLDQRERVAMGAASLTNNLDAPLRHLSILTGEAPIARALSDPSAANLASMEDSFSTLMLRNPFYDQIRWIDQDGMEKVRINMSSTGPVVVPAIGLQNKKDRPYFTDTMALPRGEMLVSPMDLNVENSRIEIPHKPTVRLAVPVFTSAGQARGILIINVLMAPLLERFSNQVERGTNRAMLLNGEGYWLYSTNTADEWAFMFKRDDRMSRDFPEIWKLMQAQATGNLIGDNGIWAWQRVDIDSNTGRYGLHQQSPWTVALYLPQKRVMVDSYRILTRLAWFVALILLALALLSWQLATNRRRRELAVHVRLKTEAELTASEERVADLLQHQETRSMLASIVASSDDAIIGTGLDDVINSWNPGAEKLFGYLAHEMLNQSAYMLVPLERSEEARRLVEQTKHLVEANRNLELALSRAESATRAKSSFLSNMSHEIRTPMNAVLGLTYLLERTALNADQRDLVRKIITAGHSLLGIINDILDVSKIEAGRLEVEHVPFRLSAVLENVVNITAPISARKTSSWWSASTMSASSICTATPCGWSRSSPTSPAMPSSSPPTARSASTSPCSVKPATR